MVKENYLRAFLFWPLSISYVLLIYLIIKGNRDIYEFNANFFYYLTDMSTSSFKETEEGPFDSLFKSLSSTIISFYSINL